MASTGHETFLRGLGAAEYVDYTTTDVAGAVQGVDHLVDLVGGPDAYRLTAALRDGGVLTPIFFGDYRPDELAARGIRVAAGQVRSHGGQLGELAALLEAGTVRVAIDSVYPLADAWRAHGRAERGHLQGKIVLRVADGQTAGGRSAS